MKNLIHRAGRFYVSRLCRVEYSTQTFQNHNERPVEYGFALGALAQYRPKTVLDVGTGTTAWPHLLRNCGFVVTAIDNVRDYWPAGMVNRHWTVLDVDIVNPGESLNRNYDAITCISVLEHIEDHAKAMRNMVQALNPSGILVLTTPFSHNNPDPNVYLRPDALYGKDLPYICRSSSARELQEWLSTGLTLERREMWRMFTGPVWASGQRTEWQRVESEAEPHQLGCFVFRKA